MAQSGVKSFSSLFNNLNIAIRQSLVSNVLPAVQDQIYKNIYSYVYDVYQPLDYSRKKDSGGLSDKDNMIFDESQLKSSNRLIIRSIRDSVNQDTGKFVDAANIVQTGKGYTRNFAYKGIPRNYTAITKSDMQGSRFHTKALQRGLRGLGLKVRDK